MLMWGTGGCVVSMSAWHDYVGGTRGSDIVSNAADVLGMSVGRRMRELVEYVRYVCVWLGAAWVERG